MKSFFISSTFRDMQEERDVIHKIVFPAVRNTLTKYNESVEEIDLRWGVDTLNLSEEDGGHMVMKVCIDAIDRCIPYFIVLLGERYGWIPTSNLFQNINDKRLEQFDKNISITEMEIQYGALTRAVGLEQCIFCFRNDSFISQIPPELSGDYVSESPQHKEKLEKLKSSIRSIDTANILEYEVSWDEQAQKVCGLEIFAQKLQQMLIDLLKNEGLSSEPLCEEEKITRNANFVMQQHLSTYVNRQKGESMLPILYASGKSVWISGESGCGKTSFLSFAANQCRQNNMISCIYYGGNSGCQSTNTFLSWLCYELEKICGKKLKDDNKTKRRSVKKIQSLSKLLTKPVMVFVDAIDQMSKDMVWTLVQLRNTTSKLQFFVTSTQNLCDIDVKEAEDLFVLRKLERLTDTELELIVSKVTGQRGKTLDAKVTKKIREKQVFHLPINLSLLLQRLFMMDGAEFAQAEKLASGMEGISRYMQNLVDSSKDTTEELISEVVDKTIEIMQPNGGETITKLFGLLSVAPEGINLRTLASLCEKTTMLQIQQLFCFVYDMVEETEDGRWRYKHPRYAECIKNIISDDALSNYEEQLFNQYSQSREFTWSEYISLGKKLGKTELADEIADALESGVLTKEQIWKESNLVKLALKSKNETFHRCILHGIACGEINLSEEYCSFLQSIDSQNYHENETLFYMYAAKSNMYSLFVQFKKEDECQEKQYQVFTQIENPCQELLFDVIKLCAENCCSYKLETARLWFQRLSETESRFFKLYKNTDKFLLINSILVWYAKFLDYEEFKKEEDLKDLYKFFDANNTIYSMQDSLNLYEQENPDHNEKCLEQLGVFARNLSSLHLDKKEYSKAYPYAKANYTLSKKAYQLNRTLNTADRYSRAAISLMRCMKQESDARKKYGDEALSTLEWMNSVCSCAKAEELIRHIYTMNAEGENAESMREKALQVSKRLLEKYPENHYDEWVLFDCRKYKDALKSYYEHINIKKTLTILSEIEAISNDLYLKTNDEYFIDILHEWALDMMQAHLWTGNFDEAEKYLQTAEEHLGCKYIQTGKFRWHREVFTAVNGLVLYYLKGDKTQTERYMQKAEILFADEEEKNKNKGRVNTAILWSGRIFHMKARMLWEETHDVEKTRSLLDTFFSQYSKAVDENEQRPARLLLAQVYAFEGNNDEAITELNKCCMNDNVSMGWQKTLMLTEYSVWQFLIAAKASLMIYDLTDAKNKSYLNQGLRALNSILSYHTLDKNPSYRKTAGNLLTHYFMKYQQQASKAVVLNVADILLKWMSFESENRELTKNEKELVAQCLIYQSSFDTKGYTQEDEKALKWLTIQQKMYPHDAHWNDKINRFLVKKALWHCINDEYSDALQLCQSIPDGEFENYTKEKNILLDVCTIRCTKAGSSQTLVSFCEEIDAKKAFENNDLWLHLEAMVALGYCLPDKTEFYYRKVAKIFEERILENNKEDIRLWKKDYNLRLKCLEYSQHNQDVSVYLDDIKAVRAAWARISGNDKKSIATLLEWDSKIAYIYEAFDEKLQWARWETVCSLLVAFLVKKDLLNADELTQVIAFYNKLLKKTDTATSLRYYTLSGLLDLALESMTRLYYLTNDVIWLEKAREALETYRMQINSAKFEDNRESFRNEKTAESYLYDMDVFQIYLENGISEDSLCHLVETAKNWVACIPDYYREIITSAVGILKQIDEYLEGRNLEIKTLVHTAQMLRQGDTNEIFWFIKGILDKHGTQLTLDDIQKMYEKERNESQNE